MSRTRRDKTKALGKPGRGAARALHKRRHAARAAAGEWKPRGQMVIDNQRVKKGRPPKGMPPGGVYVPEGCDGRIP